MHDTANPAPLYQPIAAALNQFANKHGLVTERFRQDGPTWDFLFRHPHIGSVMIQVLPAHGEGYSLVATWTAHDLAKRLRMYKRSDIIPVSSDSQTVTDSLEELLKKILSWDGSTWTEIAHHYPFVGDDVIANAIERDAGLPLPRLVD